MERAGSQRLALIPALAGLAGFMLMALVWAGNQHGLFHSAITLWGVWPGDHPFSDLEVLLAGIECKRLGINAYVINPCDSTGRTFSYPPAWLALSVFPVKTSWMVPLGIALSLGFIASLLLLPPARTAGSARLVGAGVLSSAAVFAVERGNIELVVFILVALAAALLSRRGDGVGAQWSGYGLIQLAGLLKYFPLAAMALALTQRPARLFAVAAASIAATALYLFANRAMLSDALATIPFGSPFRLVFGASNLGGGLAMLGAPPALGQAATALLVLAGLGCGLVLGLRPAAATAIAALDRRERLFLLAGGTLIVGCFFTAQNINYRAVQMLLMLPSLTALRDSNGQGGNRRYASLCWVALALLWMDFFRIKILAVAYLFTGTLQHLIEAVPGFLLREVLWWWFIVHTAALLTAILKDAPVVTSALARFSSRPLPAAGS